MTIRATYFDGQSARRYEVTLDYQNRLVLILDEAGTCLATWDDVDISLIEKSRKGEPLYLKCEGRENARLVVSEEADKDAVFKLLPELRYRSEHRKENKVAIRIAVGLLICAVGAYFSLPYAARFAAQMVPVEWEREHFEGIGVSVAKNFGAKKQCVGPDGTKVLKDMVVRFVGAEDAKGIKVIVADHKMVNAFATPGGEIIIMRGLIERAGSSNEVAGVVAHELGHVIERHTIQAYARHYGMVFLLSLMSGGNVVELGGLLAELSYSRDNEREADAFALKVLKDNNINADGMADFFEALHKEHGEMEEWIKFVSTHPQSKDRAEIIRKQEGGEDAMSIQDWWAIQAICEEKRSL